MTTKRSLMDRFWEKVDREGPIHPTLQTRCWVWLGGRGPGGYGAIRAGKSTEGQLSAHRVALEYRLGRALAPAPYELALHRCDHPWCVNPDHLFAGTPVENTADMIAKGRACFEAKHPRAKLTPEMIVSARVRKSAGETVVAMAAEFGVSHTALGYALAGKTWKSLHGG